LLIASKLNYISSVQMSIAFELNCIGSLWMSRHPSLIVLGTCICRCWCNVAL